MEIRKSKLGRDYQVMGICKVPNTSKFVNRNERSHYCERIKFLDNGEINYIFYDHSNNVYKKELLKPHFF